MSKEKCPKCESTNCYSYDNQPISHDKKWFKDALIQNDYDIIIHFKCDDCDNRWNVQFDLVPKGSV